MFLEQTGSKNKAQGWIEVICGGMFSGKTEELLRRYRRAEIAGQKSMLFKPSIDKRYADDKVVSHNKICSESISVKSAFEILDLVNEPCDLIAIDEAQFLDNGLIDVCNTLANRGIRVLVAGLDMDYNGAPFGPIPSLLARAEYVTKLHAICLNCGGLAHFSHRLAEEDSKVLIGEKKEYEPLCRSCFAATKENN